MKNKKNRKAIILLSGGLDSLTVLAYAVSRGYETYALSFDYGQRHKWEIESAKRIAALFNVAEHKIIKLDLGSFGGSALTADIDVPKGRVQNDLQDGIPITYVPARNTVFLSLALAWAEVLTCGDIFIGVNAMDYSGYPDCRPEFLAAFENLANLATRLGTQDKINLRIHAPLINRSKAEIIKLGTSLGVDYNLTTTCYDPDVQGHPCGECDACMLRLKGFREAGLTDPLTYPVK